MEENIQMFRQICRKVIIFGANYSQYPRIYDHLASIFGLVLKRAFRKYML